jgi:predicted N-acetyltransferase YhbS
MAAGPVVRRADDDDMLAGTIQCWPVALNDAAGAHPMIMVGPVAVMPALQGKGMARRSSPPA